MTDPTPYTSYRIAGWSGLSGGLIRLLTNAGFDDPIMQRSRALVHDGAEFHQLVALFTARPDLAYALVGPVGDVTQVVVNGGVRADLITPSETIEIAGTPDGGDWAGHMITAAVLGVTLTVAAHSPQQTVNPVVRATTAPEIPGPIAVPTAPVAPPFEPRIPDPPRVPDPPRLPDPQIVPDAVESVPDRPGPTTTAPPTIPPPPPLRPPNYAATALRTADVGSAEASGAVSPEPAAGRLDADPRYAAPIDVVSEPPGDESPDAVSGDWTDVDRQAQPDGFAYPDAAYDDQANPDRADAERSQSQSTYAATAYPEWTDADQPPTHPDTPYAAPADADQPYTAYPERGDADERQVRPAPPSYPDSEPRVVSWDAPPADPTPAVPAQRPAGLISDVSWASMLDGADAFLDSPLAHSSCWPSR